MERYEILPVVPSALPDVAEFLARWRCDKPGQQRVPESTAGIERRLKWLTLDNPAAADRSHFGFYLRDSAGTVRGLNLAFPAAFVWDGQRLLGLASGSFFVEPAARSMGFYVFKKYLGYPGYSFFFATTCNSYSVPLWSELGGRAVPNSEMESIVPLRLDVMMAAFVAAKTSNALAEGLARFAARFANPLLQLLTRPSAAKLTVEPCHDWEKLAALSRRNRSSQYLTSDRSVEFLKWRYGPDSPLYPCGIYVFRDEQGNEGWFSLGNLIRGEQGQFRGSVLIDAIWPREKMNFNSIFAEILRLTSHQADAIFLRSQPQMDYRQFSRFVIPYKLPTPRVFVLTKKGSPPIDPGSLDYDDSDYGAWRFHWSQESQ